MPRTHCGPVTSTATAAGARRTLRNAGKTTPSFLSAWRLWVQRAVPTLSRRPRAGRWRTQCQWRLACDPSRVRVFSFNAPPFFFSENSSDCHCASPHPKPLPAGTFLYVSVSSPSCGEGLPGVHSQMNHFRHTLRVKYTRYMYEYINDRLTATKANTHTHTLLFLA